MAWHVLVMELLKAKKKNVHIEPGNAVSRCVVVTAVAGAEASQKQK